MSQAPARLFPRENGNLLKEKLKETEASADFLEEVKSPGPGFMVRDYVSLSRCVGRQDETEGGAINRVLRPAEAISNMWS